MIPRNCQSQPNPLHVKHDRKTLQNSHSLTISCLTRSTIFPDHDLHYILLGQTSHVSDSDSLAPTLHQRLHMRKHS